VKSHRSTRRRRAAVPAAVLVLAATVLTGAGPAVARETGTHGPDSCRPYPPVTAHPWVKIVAKDNAFDTDCFKAPPDRGFRVYLRNNDADTPHNLSIYSADPSTDMAARQLFKGKPVKAPWQEEYSVDALPAGQYWFQDDKTPDMNGVIEIDKKR